MHIPYTGDLSADTIGIDLTCLKECNITKQGSFLFRGCRVTETSLLHDMFRLFQIPITYTLPFFIPAKTWLLFLSFSCNRSTRMFVAVFYVSSGTIVAV